MYPSLSQGPIKWNEFAEIMQNTTNLKISLKSKTDIENAAQVLRTSIQSAIYKSSHPYTPRSMNQTNNQTLPIHIRTLISDKRRVRSRWQKYRYPSDKQIFNHLTNIIKKLISKHKSEFFEKKYQSLNTNDGSIWKTTKNLLNIKQQMPPITGPNRSIAISDGEKANLFGEYFSNIFKPHTDIHPSTEHLERINSFIDSPLPMSLPAKHTSPSEIKFLINVAQAFDRVWHKGLLFNLKMFLPAPYFLIICSYLENRTYTVRYGNSVSSFYPIKAGVPQDSDLSSNLFNVYTADIPKTPNTVMATYADDTAILSPGNDPVKTVHFLQTHLDLIDKWSPNWKIKINPDNSIYVPFTLKMSIPLPLYFQGIQIPISSESTPLTSPNSEIKITLSHKTNHLQILITAYLGLCYPNLGMR
ncbi:hypothetical protein QTP88_023004 [Uroleucon formosanum]